MSNDTIIALSTAPGPSAIAILRLSGPLAHKMLQRHAKVPLEIRRAHFAHFRGDTDIIDDVVVTAWKGPASYTGEDLVEISCHGNMLIVQQIIRILCREGARMAGPGEFTQRAFLNDKLDLTQAEAVMDLIQARSERALKSARALQSGKLGKMVLNERETLLQVLAHLEAYIDFPDEDIAPDVSSGFAEKVKRVRLHLQELLASGREGRLLRSGLSVVIAGAPNAGKSTLLNALLERDRAIVSPVAGTTRDTIEEVVLIEGIEIRLIDSAGLHSNPAELEKLGIERTFQALNQADLILLLIDGHDSAIAPVTEKFPADVPVITCLTKSDLPLKNTTPGLPVSVHGGTGLTELKAEMARILGLVTESPGLDHVAINSRHEALLTSAVESLDRAITLITEQAPPELISSDLRQALESCGKIVGEVTNEDILDRLFKNFCIGK